MTDHYVDSNATGPLYDGSIGDPYLSYSDVTVGTNDNVYFKRGSEFPDGKFLVSNVAGVTLDAYGDTADPLPVFKNLIYSTDRDDWTDTGGNIWTIEIDVSSRAQYLMSFGDIDTFYPRIDTTGAAIGPLPLTTKGDWDYVVGDDVSVMGYFKVYCEQNPIDEWGSLGYNDVFESCIRFNRQGGTVQNLAFTKCVYGVLLTSWTTANSLSNMNVNNCEFDKVWSGIYATGLNNDATALYQDLWIHHNTVTNCRAAGIQFRNAHRNTIVEYNRLINGGLQVSTAGIYAGRILATVGEPAIIRNNYVDTYTYYNYWNDGDGIYTDVEGEYVDVYSNYITNMDLEYGAGLRNNAGNKGTWHSNIVENAAYGIRVSNSEGATTYDVDFYNNTFKGITVEGWKVTGNVTDTDVVDIRNNCFVGDSGEYRGHLDGTAALFTHDYNSYFGFVGTFDNESAGANDVTTDPQLVSNIPGTSGSPIAGAGDNSVIPLNDYNGNAFDATNPNMGAYSSTADHYVINTGNTADSFGTYDGLWDTVDWQYNDDRSIHYPMNEGA